MCRCCLADVETVDHYLFFCPFFNFHRTQIKYCCKKITKGWPPKLSQIPQQKLILALIHYLHPRIQTSNPFIFVFLVILVTAKIVPELNWKVLGHRFTRNLSIINDWKRFSQIMTEKKGKVIWHDAQMTFRPSDAQPKKKTLWNSFFHLIISPKRLSSSC